MKEWYRVNGIWENFNEEDFKLLDKLKNTTSGE